MKKGQFNEMGYVIMFVIVLVVFAFLILQLKGGLIRNVDDVTCKSSVLAQKEGHTSSGVGYVAEELRCPTNYLTIDSSDPMEIKSQIAEEMRKCYADFGEGKEDK